MNLTKYDKFVNEARDLMLAKSKKYHGTDDILTSWRKTSDLTGVPIETLLVTRLYEKLARMATMLKEKPSDKPQDDLGESLLDSAIDSVNYTLFLCVALNERIINQGKLNDAMEAIVNSVGWSTPFSNNVILREPIEQ